MMVLYATVKWASDAMRVREEFNFTIKNPKQNIKTDFAATAARTQGVGVCAFAYMQVSHLSNDGTSLLR